MRPIDADAIVYETNKALIRTGEGFIRKCDIEREPTIEVKLVRHGYLHDVYQMLSGEILGVCSECGEQVPVYIRKNYIKYCPFCGAKVVDF